MNNSLIPRFIAELKAKQAEISEAAMLQPRSELLHYGIMAGRFQGIQVALDTIESIVNDELKQELNS